MSWIQCGSATKLNGGLTLKKVKYDQIFISWCLESVRRFGGKMRVWLPTLNSTDSHRLTEMWLRVISRNPPGGRIWSLIVSLQTRHMELGKKCDLVLENSIILVFTFSSTTRSCVNKEKPTITFKVGLEENSNQKLPWIFLKDSFVSFLYKLDKTGLWNFWKWQHGPILVVLLGSP